MCLEPIQEHSPWVPSPKKNSIMETCYPKSIEMNWHHQILFEKENF